MTANDLGALLVVIGVKNNSLISGVRSDIHRFELSVRDFMARHLYPGLLGENAGVSEF
jgi:hypothetical protein